MIVIATSMAVPVQCLRQRLALALLQPLADDLLTLHPVRSRMEDLFGNRQGLVLYSLVTMQFLGGLQSPHRLDIPAPGDHADVMEVVTIRKSGNILDVAFGFDHLAVLALHQCGLQL